MANFTKINQLLDRLRKEGTGGEYHPDCPKAPYQPRAPQQKFRSSYEPLRTDVTYIDFGDLAKCLLEKAGITQPLPDDVMAALERGSIEIERDSCGDTISYLNWRTDEPNPNYEADHQRWLREQAVYERDVERFEAQLEAYVTKNIEGHKAFQESQEREELARLLKKYGG